MPVDLFCKLMFMSQNVGKMSLFTVNREREAEGGRGQVVAEMGFR